MIETGGHHRLLDCAQRYIGDRQNIAPTLGELREHRTILDGLCTEFDQCVGSLNDFFQTPREVTQSQVGLFPHAIEAQALLGGQRLPTLAELETSGSFSVGKAGIQAFRDANLLMQRGESKGKRPRWEFHKDIHDPEKLAATLMLEIYGKYVSLRYPNTYDGTAITLALKEMLAFYHQETRLFTAVKQWISIDEDFSQLLTDIAHNQLTLRFEAGKILRETTNFRVVMDYEPGREGRKEGQRFFIEPRTDQGHRMLSSAAETHDVTNNFDRRNVTTPEGLVKRDCLRADLIPVNLRVLFGVYVGIPRERGDFIPSIDRMEERIRLYRLHYTFSDGR